MKVLIDTNVILDFMLQRKPYYENAAKIIILSEKNHIYACISASAVTDIFYIANKNLKDKTEALTLLKNLLEIICIAGVAEVDIHKAIDLNWEDFEDAVQYVIGQNISVDYIITRNPRDFPDSQIQIVSPEKFLAHFISQKQIK